MNIDLSKVEKSTIENLNKSSINSFDIIKNQIISCCEEELNIYNLDTKTKTNIYQVKNDQTEELNCFRYLDANNIFLSNQHFIQLFDLNSQKQINKFKFFKDTINCMEFNKQGNILTCCDDTGEIKLLDLRVQSNVLNLTLRKSLKTHENICYTLKYNPLNENELFSGSFDCTFIKWDIRFPKKDSKKQYVKQVSISDELQKLIKIQKDDPDFMLSTMTPSFIHSLFFTELNENKMGLLCGIENGYAMLFETDTCKLIDGKQITNNLAVTQFDKFETVVDKNLIVTSGDSKMIEFLYLNKKEIKNKDKVEIGFDLNKFQEMKIEYKKKVNCLKYLDHKLFIADTTSGLSFYNFQNFLEK